MDTIQVQHRPLARITIGSFRTAVLSFRSMLSEETALFFLCAEVWG